MLEPVQLIFGKGKSLASYAIRLRYQSRWSHCGVIINDVVHEAVYPDGVIKTPLKDFKKRYGAGRFEVATAYAGSGWRQRANAELGKAYDLFGAAGLGFGTRKFDHPDKLWCSHHVGLILGTLRAERLNRLAPEHLWMISHEPGATL